MRSRFVRFVQGRLQLNRRWQSATPRGITYKQLVGSRAQLVWALYLQPGLPMDAATGLTSACTDLACTGSAGKQHTCTPCRAATVMLVELGSMRLCASRSVWLASASGLTVLL